MKYTYENKRVATMWPGFKCLFQVVYSPKGSCVQCVSSGLKFRANKLSPSSPLVSAKTRIYLRSGQFVWLQLECCTCVSDCEGKTNKQEAKSTSSSFCFYSSQFWDFRNFLANASSTKSFTFDPHWAEIMWVCWKPALQILKTKTSGVIGWSPCWWKHRNFFYWNILNVE